MLFLAGFYSVVYEHSFWLIGRCVIVLYSGNQITDKE